MGSLRGIVWFSLCEASNSVVSRGFNQSDIKMNEAFVERNSLGNLGVKIQLVRHFSKKEFYKCIE